MKSPANRRILCACLGVTESRVAACVRSGRACSVSEVMACTEAGTGCTACHQDIEAVVERNTRAADASVAQRATG